MEKLVYEQSQKPILIKVFQSQIEDLKGQLRGLYALLGQIDSTLVDPEYLDSNNIERLNKPIANQAKRVYSQREGGKDYFNKLKTVLNLSVEPLTTREILNSLYEYFPDDFNKDDDRKNIASLSAILTEKTSEEKIIRNKPAVGHAVFSLPNKYKQEEKQTMDNIDLAPKTDVEDNLDWINVETEKVDIDDDDLPF